VRLRWELVKVKSCGAVAPCHQTSSDCARRRQRLVCFWQHFAPDSPPLLCVAIDKPDDLNVMVGKSYLLSRVEQFGVVDGEPPLGLEADTGVAERKALRRAIGYKLQVRRRAAAPRRWTTAIRGPRRAGDARVAFDREGSHVLPWRIDHHGR
jgi:hypothetical protein